MKLESFRSIALILAGALALGAVIAPAKAQSPAVERIDKTKVLRVGWGVWHPYVFRDPKTNQVHGVTYDLMQDMGKSMGVRVEWVEDNWNTLAAGLQANKFEIVNLLAITPPRAQAMDFSEPVTKHGLSLIAAKDAVAKTKSWQDWDRAGVKIGLGTNSDMFVTEKFKNAEIVRMKAAPEIVLAVLTGRLQAHGSTIDALKTIQKEHPQLEIVPGSFGGSEVAFGLPKGDTQLTSRVNTFVRDAKRSGRIKQLLEKYGLDASFAVD
jgi:ABC-type amino acid transport substrate-binding protein